LTGDWQKGQGSVLRFDRPLRGTQHIERFLKKKAETASSAISALGKFAL
jgi:hypothetical protein